MVDVSKYLGAYVKISSFFLPLYRLDIYSRYFYASVAVDVSASERNESELEVYWIEKQLILITISNSLRLQSLIVRACYNSNVQSTGPYNLSVVSQIIDITVSY